MSPCVLGQCCKATSGMSPSGLWKGCVRQPLGSYGLRGSTPSGPFNELIYGLGIWNQLI
jgi:hypothetical protein